MKFPLDAYDLEKSEYAFPVHEYNKSTTLVEATTQWKRVQLLAENLNKVLTLGLQKMDSPKQ